MGQIKSLGTINPFNYTLINQGLSMAMYFAVCFSG